jgi:MFS family permease
LTRNLKITSAVSFLQDAASELLYPLMPILLTTVLGAPAAVVGAVEGVAEGVAALTKYVSGRLADRHRKVPLVGLGYGLAALGKLFVAAAGVWPVVLVGRCVDRLGKGIRGHPAGRAPGRRHPGRCPGPGLRLPPRRRHRGSRGRTAARPGGAPGTGR